MKIKRSNQTALVNRKEMKPLAKHLMEDKRTFPAFKYVFISYIIEHFFPKTPF